MTTVTRVGVLVWLAGIACNTRVEPAPEPVPSPYEQLAAMDTRAPVPLQPMMAHHQKQNMMEHLEAIQQIVDGAAREDWAQVKSAAALIETSPQMSQMCTHMGAGAPGFTELALSFHKAADTIAPAAEAADVGAVLSATSATLVVCTQCHATYRQEVVSAETFAARTGSDHQAGAHAP